MKLLQVERRAVLPRVWATDGNLAVAPGEVAREPVKAAVLAPETAFYRSYTEAMLRRYAVLRMEKGRVPSLMGREMFRGKVTSYRMRGFDDAVIFVHDVEQCIRTLDHAAQRLIVRVGVQEYTLPEVAAMLGTTFRTARRRYHCALDELTAVFLERRLLERMASNPCQGATRPDLAGGR